MFWIILISLIGASLLIWSGYQQYKRIKDPAASPTLMGWSFLALGFLLMMFPTVFWNIVVGLLAGILQLPSAIDMPIYHVKFFDPVTLPILLISTILAVITLRKLSSDAKAQGKSLSEYVMGHKPTEVPDDPRYTINRLKDPSTETYSGQTDTRFESHDPQDF